MYDHYEILDKIKEFSPMSQVEIYTAWTSYETTANCMLTLFGLVLAATVAYAIKKCN